MKKGPGECGSAGEVPGPLPLSLTLKGRGWRGEGQVIDEPWEGKEGVKGAEQPTLIILAIYKCEGLHVPAGGLHALQSRRRAADVVRRTGSDGRTERTTSGWENLLLQQGSELVPHGSLQTVQAIKLTCLGTLEERSTRLVATSHDLQYI